jgi:hypothetical protein
LKNQNTSHKLSNNANQSIIEHTNSSNLKLEEMITLEVLRSSKLTGQTKKMLHLPSMKIYVVKVKKYF